MPKSETKMSPCIPYLKTCVQDIEECGKDLKCKKGKQITIIEEDLKVQVSMAEKLSIIQNKNKHLQTEQIPGIALVLEFQIYR